MPDASRIVKIVVECGACKMEVEPTVLNFEADSDGASCPGCDGSAWQTCLCGGPTITKTIEFRCPNCGYYGTIYVN